ncbi:tetratricopeptide repeat protein [Phenylobacterium sp.]|uniref:O-linked N-acetylglucosamine transferase, SPINDLY family protein n=1 Tax=Phenylobacterium sp. TaxID=1871053 RepID=UPI002BE599AC|nr:tetratricopeptide repeat protein [Phenylobacterium sp.]HVI32383.1 tetratricopeptide repeat protein [Phenylobacterium sp.]
MSDRLAAAEAALKAGRGSEAIDHLVAAIDEDPARSVQVYRVLALQLYRAGRFAEGEAWSAKAAQRFPRDFDVWNVRGVILRQLKRYPDAVAALEQAIKLNPKNVAPYSNLGNVLMDMGEYARAEQVFTRLVRQSPRDAEMQRQLGRALLRQGRRDQAIVRFRQAVTLDKTAIEAWMDWIGTLNEEHRAREAEEVMDRAIAANPDNVRLLEARAVVIRRGGELRRAEAYLLDLLPRFENAAWLHYQLGGVVSDFDRPRANVHLRRAVELDPGKLDYRMALIESLERTRVGDEGANIEESYQLVRDALKQSAEFGPSATKIANEVLIRVCAFDDMERLGDFRTLGRSWAESGRHTALLKQLARVKTHEDRLELVEQHRIWGRNVEALTKSQPIKRPPPRPKDGKIRLGFMSSDLRQHPVGYFALPLFDHVDRERFEVYCYSYYQGKEDPLQRYIAQQVTAYRWWPDISFRDAAQAIAEDQLDMLIELGGSTYMNKLEVMAYKPAVRQASWLGYPHSAGLSTIDYLVCDPYCRPEMPDLLVEEPLMMPHTWLALGRAVFSDVHPVAETIPQDRNGFVTFGTANNPHKYSREVLRAWARVTAAVPDARFAFVRPEGGSASFRRNILAEFAAEGVPEERVLFHTTRGKHMPFYNEIDITLDPFPLTGGTTTTESLWMGVPLVSLVGEAFFERLSYSILSNVGLADLCARSPEEFHATALKLAGDPERRRALKQGLRETIRQSPLGRTEDWARDFYDMVAKAVAA